MKTDAVRVRIDPEVKAQAEAVLKELGVTPSAAVAMFYRQIAIQGGLPFAVKIPTPRTMQALAEVQSGKNLRSYASVSEMFAELDGEADHDNETD